MTFNVAPRSARLPTDPDASNVSVAPNHVTMPIGVVVIESQVEFVREFGEGDGIESDTRTQRIQVFDGAVAPSIRILRQNLGRVRNLRSWESPMFNHVNSPQRQIARNFLRFC